MWSNYWRSSRVRILHATVNVVVCIRWRKAMGQRERCISHGANAIPPKRIVPHFDVHVDAEGQMHRGRVTGVTIVATPGFFLVWRSYVEPG